MNESKEKATIWNAENFTRMMILSLGIGAVGAWLDIPLSTCFVVWIVGFVVFAFHEQLGLGQQKTPASNSKNIDDIVARIDTNIAEMRAFLAERPELEGELDELRRAAERQHDDNGDRGICTERGSPSPVVSSTVRG
jgi:hypothetical protein